MKRRSKAIGASAIILIAVLLTAVVLFATLQTALTNESARNEQNPLYVQAQSIVQARLRQNATTNNLTFRVQNVMNGTDPNARQVWATHATDHYAPLNPIQGSTYAIINVTVASAMNGTSPFRYSDVVLVGNDGRSYYANYAEGNASCSASLAAEQLTPGGRCSVYIAFSIPDGVAPAKVVYTASNPTINVDLV
ncbi:MAG: DUF4352 domain-containing protein [Halobacteriota archaeon]